MRFRPLELILDAVLKILSYPVLLFCSICEKISWEISLIQTIMAAGQELSWGRVSSLSKSVCLALLLLGVAIFLVIDTIRRVMFAEAKEKRARSLLFDILAVLLIIFLYYLLISLVLYFFFSVILPIYQVL